MAIDRTQLESKKLAPCYLGIFIELKTSQKYRLIQLLFKAFSAMSVPTLVEAECASTAIYPKLNLKKYKNK